MREREKNRERGRKRRNEIEESSSSSSWSFHHHFILLFLLLRHPSGNLLANQVLSLSVPPQSYQKRERERKKVSEIPKEGNRRGLMMIIIKLRRWKKE